MWSLIRIAAYIRITLLGNHIVAICPPLEACLCSCPLQWWWCRQWQPIFQWHHTSIPSSWHWGTTRQKLSRIIILRRRADSVIRWEHPRDLESTLLWPSAVRLSSMPQPLGNIVISPNRLFRTDESIGSGRQFQKCSRLHRAIAASPKDGATSPPRRWQDLPALHWQVQLLCISYWFLYFEVSVSLLLTDECDCSFVSLISLLTN